MAGEARSVVVRLTAETSQYIAQMKAAGAATVSSLDGATRITDKQSAALNTLGSTSGKVALAAGAGFAAVTLTTANFDKQMSAVAATGDEARGSLDALRESAIQAGADTAFSATEAAQGIEELLKAGVSTSDVLGGGLTGSLDLAAAGELDVASAAELSATALTQFGLAGSDVSHVADLLSAGAGKAQGSVADLGMALNQSGLVASQTGLSIEETVGTLSAFASAGLTGSDAGTSFKTMLQSLTPTGEKAAKTMDALGITAYDAQGNFVGMTQFADSLRNGLSDLSVEQQNAALKTIFGSDAVRAASVIYDQGAEGIQGWIDKTNDTGYAAETASTRLDNLSGDVEAFTGSLETALIGSGEGSTGALRTMVQGATAAVNAFNELPGPIKNTATGLLSITAVTGGGLWLGAKVVGGINDTRDALANLGPAGARASGILGKVGKAAGVATLAYTGLALAAETLSDPTPVVGAEKTEAAIRRVAEGNRDAGVSFDELFTRQSGGSAWYNNSQQSIEGLDDALQKLSKNGVSQLLDSDVLGALGLSETKYDLARESVAALDAQMSALVQGGDTQAAAAAFDYFSASATDAGFSSKEIAALLPSYSDALVGLQNDASTAAGAETQYASAAEEAAAAAKDQAQAVNQAAQAMRDKTSATLAAFDAETSYRQALKDAADQADENNAGIRGNSEAALANREALSGLAAAWDGQSAAVKNNVGRYQEARQSFIDIATAMGIPEKRAKELANTMLEIPRKVVATAELYDQLSPKAKDVVEELRKIGYTKAEATATLQEGPFKTAAAWVRGALGDIDGSQAKPKVDVVDAPFKSKTAAMRAQLRELNSSDAKPKADLMDQALRAGVSSSRGALDQLDRYRARPTVDANIGPLQAAISQAKGLFASLPSSKTVTLTTIHREITQQLFGGGTKHADGGLIRGPGGPRDDVIPALVSNREYIVNAASVDHYGVNFMDAINARRFADGGDPGNRLAAAQAFTTPAASLARFGGPSTTHASTKGPTSALDLTRQYDALVATLDGFNNGIRGKSKKQVEILGKDLDRTESQLERLGQKRVDLAQKTVDADKDRLRTLLDAQKAIEQQVQGLFAAKLGSDASTTSFDVALPDNFQDLSPEQKRAELESRSRLNTTLNAGLNDPVARDRAAITASTAEAGEALRIYRSLAKKGFDGPAFKDLVGRGDLATLRAYDQLSRQEIAQYETSFVRNQKALTGAGAFVGADIYGARVDDARADAKASVSELRDLNKTTKGVETEIKHLRRDQDRIARKIGDAVGESLDDVAAAAARRRRNARGN